MLEVLSDDIAIIFDRAGYMPRNEESLVSLIEPGFYEITNG